MSVCQACSVVSRDSYSADGKDFGQFLYAPVMSVCGMKLGWIVYGVFTLIGLVILIAAIGASPYRKSLKN